MLGTVAGLLMLGGVAAMPVTDWQRFDLPQVPQPGQERHRASKPGITEAEALAESAGVGLGTAAACRVELTRLMRVEGLVLNALKLLSVDEYDRQASVQAYLAFRNMHHRSGAGRRTNCAAVEMEMATLERTMGLR